MAAVGMLTARPWAVPDQGTSRLSQRSPTTALDDAAGDLAKGSKKLLASLNERQDPYESLSPCSCDCCQVEERLPDEVVQLANDVSLRYKCSRTGDPSDGMFTTRCPEACQMGNNPSIIATAKGHIQVDYPRFCRYKCKPTLPSVGSQCRRLNITETEMLIEPTRNGKGDAPFFAAVNGSTEEEKNSLNLDTNMGLALDGDGHLLDVGARKMKWDLRKLIAGRYRAEAGAEMTSMLAGGQFVRTYKHEVEEATGLTKRVSDAISDAEPEIDGSMIQTDQRASAAEESEVAAEKSLSEAQLTTGDAKEEAAEVAKEAIEQNVDVQKLVDDEAQADVKRYGWDKPDFWPKVLAVKAADPYMTQMVTAIQRASEYESYAKTLLSQARNAQTEATGLNSQANVKAASGDSSGAHAEFEQVKALIGRSKKLELEAQKFWKVASDTQQTIPEWQSAGMSAATYTAWMYSQSFTPPPEPSG
eukprot:gnl/TRDRNA2_/TRDRNA2_182735_c0_seq1.p1 gnl/TRDRNA2_/TRDRNA2_182735_c0~~gnl/TRDRNA2_/TRDRNA2_182735_c0_seq1.p1  ORF type:complete len:501 (+),score=83.50 gnl/TRDRNA2_/TRDRNA2_182735_c0_seq1:83-1504(+)